MKKTIYYVEISTKLNLMFYELLRKVDCAWKVALFFIIIPFSGCTKKDEISVPADDLILFWSDRDGNGEIYRMDTEGSNVTRLTSNNSNDFNPQWSPDRKKIVFESARDGNRFLRLFSCYGGSLSSPASGADGPLPGTLPSFRQVPDGV